MSLILGIVVCSLVCVVPSPQVAQRRDAQAAAIRDGRGWSGVLRVRAHSERASDHQPASASASASAWQWAAIGGLRSVEPTHAEFGVIVARAHQRSGLGAALYRACASVVFGSAVRAPSV